MDCGLGGKVAASITDVTSPPRAVELEVLSQTALGKHLFKASEKVVANQRKRGKESFAAWSRESQPLSGVSKCDHVDQQIKTSP